MGSFFALLIFVFITITSFLTLTTEYRNSSPKEDESAGERQKGGAAEESPSPGFNIDVGRNCPPLPRDCVVIRKNLPLAPAVPAPYERVGEEVQLLRDFLRVDEKRSGPESPTRRVIDHDLDEEDVSGIQIIGK